MSLYLQRVLGIGPALTGVEFLPFALGVVAGSHTRGENSATAFLPGSSWSAVGCSPQPGFAWFSLISSSGTFAVDVLGPSIFASVGFGLCLGPVVSTATIGVDPQETGTASGLLNSSRQIGASLGLATLGTAAAHRTGPIGTPHALTAGYSLGLILECSTFTGRCLHCTYRPASDKPTITGRAGRNAKAECATA